MKLGKHIFIACGDISHPDFEEQIKIVESTLHDIDSSNKATILIFNKIDKHEKGKRLTPSTKKTFRCRIKNTWI